MKRLAFTGPSKLPEGFEALVRFARLVETLKHEARHVAEPEWDCGNRDVLGRGGPS